jgi:ADP-dependent NAD(P)H-hydrate dehydratase / NAD(P)H-hydrate epimerase
MIVTPSQMKAAEELAFARGKSAEGLMKIAGRGIAETLRQFFMQPATLIVYCGKGHNGADALVAARHLAGWDWKILIRLASPVSELAPLTLHHLEALSAVSILDAAPENIRGDMILLDGLLGIGSTGAPRGVLAERIREMNLLRQVCGGYSVAVDIPSGLDGATGEVFNPCIQADLTITLGFVKTGLIADSATDFVGRLALISLSGVSCEEPADNAEVLTTGRLRPLLPIRNFDSHKGTYGRIGILAGSRGTLGAARLSSAAAVHAGGGLVTLYTLADNYELLASLCIPEVMVQSVDSYLDILQMQHDVLALGPGLGRAHDADLIKIIREAPFPCVVDADALNALATDLSILTSCSGPRLLTPHPGEMERLFPQQGRTRRAWAEEFVTRYPVTLLLKGARTVIAERNKTTVFNTTGNPGMGSGGMGDSLTGVCAALIGGGHEVRDAAMLGAWLCGRAAEIAIFNRCDSQESLAASAILTHLGAACASLRKGEY